MIFCFKQPPKKLKKAHQPPNTYFAALRGFGRYYYFILGYIYWISCIYGMKSGNLVSPKFRSMGGLYIYPTICS